MADFNSNAPVIRVVKKKNGHGGHHGGAWKVAYADFVTAMMAFFLVMWIVGLSKPIRQAIAAYFRDPSGFMKTGHGGKSPMAEGTGIKEGRKGKPAPLVPEDAGRDSAATAALDNQVRAMLDDEFKSVQATITKELEKTPEFKGLKESVQIHQTNEGLRIELIERTSSLFFDTGSANLKPRTVHLLHLIAKELSHIDRPVVLEGHTDSVPLNGANGYSNWELSADRANAARRAMEDHGLREDQVIAVHGYADHKLLVPDDPTHFSNRRVSILVAYTQKGQ